MTFIIHDRKGMVVVHDQQAATTAAQHAVGTIWTIEQPDPLTTVVTGSAGVARIEVQA